jgi:hypothetical protein
VTGEISTAPRKFMPIIPTPPLAYLAEFVFKFNLHCETAVRPARRTASGIHQPGPTTQNPTLPELQHTRENRHQQIRKWFQD